LCGASTLEVSSRRITERKMIRKPNNENNIIFPLYYNNTSQGHRTIAGNKTAFIRRGNLFVL